MLQTLGAGKNVVFLAAHFLAARQRGAYVGVTCDSRGQAGHAAKKHQRALVYIAAWPPGTAHSLAQSGPLGRRGHPATKKHRGAFMFLLRGLPEPLTHSRRPGHWDAAATQQHKNTGARSFFAARPLTHAGWDASATQKNEEKNTGARFFVLTARLPGTAHSFTDAGPLGRRGEPNFG